MYLDWFVVHGFKAHGLLHLSGGSSDGLDKEGDPGPHWCSGKGGCRASEGIVDYHNSILLIYFYN